jgi:hypothetical protein
MHFENYNDYIVVDGNGNSQEDESKNKKDVKTSEKKLKTNVHPRPKIKKSNKVSVMHNNKYQKQLASSE